MNYKSCKDISNLNELNYFAHNIGNSGEIAVKSIRNPHILVVEISINPNLMILEWNQRKLDDFRMESSWTFGGAKYKKVCSTEFPDPSY